MQADSLGQADLEVPVEQLAPQRYPGGEHGGVHEAHRLPVHQEPLLAGGGQVVGRAGRLDPEADLRSRPPPRVKGQLQGEVLRTAPEPLLDDEVEGLGGVEAAHVHLLLAVDGGPGEPGHLEAGGEGHHAAVVLHGDAVLRRMRQGRALTAAVGL